MSARFRRFSPGDTRRWSLGWVVKEYGKLFPDESPNMRDVTADEWRREHARLMLFASERGFRPGWVGYRFKALSGRWPDRTWGFDWRRYA